jgi:hypothetical protein
VSLPQAVDAPYALFGPHRVHSPNSAALQGHDHLLVRLGQRQILLRVRAEGKETAS